MDNVFDKLGDLADRARIERHTAFSRSWFEKQIKANFKDYTFGKMERESKGLTRQRMGVGRTYMFQYDAKYKDELPYWDRFPLVIVLDIGKKHVLGLNLHYIAPKTRAVILARLYDIASSKVFDERTKLKLTYGMVKSISKWKLLKPCIKKYLKTNFRSKFVHVDFDNLEQAIFLPVEQFMKADKRTVWRKSRESVT